MFPTLHDDIEPGNIFKSTGYTPRRAQPLDPKAKTFWERRVLSVGARRGWAGWAVREIA
jgi:hypothetical protein